MKIRQGFVSNSSSASFVVSLRKLSLEQLCKIMNHTKWGKEFEMNYYEDSWSITVEDGVLHGSTSMDNFDMEAFLVKIGITDAVWGEMGDKLQEKCAVITPCDTCDKCVMRFVCYTNEWVKNEN